MSYFQLLPSELIDEIALYLDYTELSIIEEIFNIRTEYKRLVREKYPAFHEIITFLINNDVKYRDYSWRRGYDLINMVEKYINYEMYIRVSGVALKNNLRTNNVDNFISSSYEALEQFDDMTEILTLYEAMTSQESFNYKDYIRYFPNISGIDICLLNIGFTYMDNMSLDYIIKKYESNMADNYGGNISEFSLIQPLCIIFLYILRHPDSVSEYKNKILNIKISNIKGRVSIRIIDHRLLHKYMIDFINNQEERINKIKSKII